MPDMHGSLHYKASEDSMRTRLHTLCWQQGSWLCWRPLCWAAHQGAGMLQPHALPAVQYGQVQDIGELILLQLARQTCGVSHTAATLKL